MSSFFFCSKKTPFKYFALGISPTDTTNKEIDKNNVIGKKIFKIFKGFKPKEVITISSYSLESFVKVITSETKKILVLYKI